MSGGAGPAGTGGGLSTIAAGPSCVSTCSSDLKQVLCDGMLMEECPGDLACLNGGCSSDPCAAAAAAKGSFGCDFWALKPDVIQPVRGACFAAFVANTWSVPAHIDVTYKGQALPPSFIFLPQGQGKNLTYAPYDPVAGLAPGQVATLFLAHDTQALGIDCPNAPAIDGPAGVNGTGFGHAFHIKADRPVVAYSMFPYGGGSAQATSASLLFPVSAWDDNYVAVSAFAKTQTFGPGVPSLDILAHEDGTQIALLPGVAVVGGGGVASTPANQPLIYSLNAGQFLQIAQVEELTGSPIQSNKPVGVWGAASCLSVPADKNFCDSAHQQIPPVRALGSRYAAVRYRNRKSSNGQEEAPPWRLVGAVDGTQLAYKPFTPQGAPLTLALGEVAQFDSSGGFTVASQDASHPFYFGQYMTGSEVFGGNEGDPEWVNIVPVDQYLSSYVFFTDPTYSETNLVVIRSKNKATMTFDDVELDCAGPLANWQSLADDLEFTRIDLVTGDFESVGNCSNGRHEMKSKSPFGVTVWGWGTLGLTPSTHDVSYAYPGGASVQIINEVVVPAIPD